MSNRSLATEQFSAHLADRKLIAIVRRPKGTAALTAARWLLGGGLHMLEITCDTPDVLDVIAQLRTEFKAALIGMGGLVDLEVARSGIAAGAQFLVSPVFQDEMQALAHSASIALLPGVFTPTEIDRAQRAGAGALKLYPASIGGAEYIAQLRGPFPDARLVPVGGVTSENAGALLRAGAIAVAAGSALTEGLRDAADAAQRVAAWMSAIRSAA